MDFDTWWQVTGQLDEGGKDDWLECWSAATLAERERCAKLADSCSADVLLWLHNLAAEIRDAR